MADAFIVRKTTAQFTAENEIFLDNVTTVCTNIVNGVETDTGYQKLGNGITPWNALSYVNTGGGASVPVSIANGGTGAITADAALTNLGILRSYLATTVTYNNDDTLADTALSVTVAAGGTYDVELVVQSTSAVKGLALDFAGTATFTNFIGTWQAAAANGSASTPALQQVTSSGTDFIDNTSATDAVNGLFTFKGTAEFAAAGTFLLRGAQNAADVSNTTILRGSVLTLTKMN